ncbi:MAG: ATP-binding cassette domain-containing protein [Bacteroidia bacterium]|jgi:ABC-type multidrug transport system ATPase subunit|nr:ATP-binding cassette domain-containing protein [Bacteroidia bacterium]
MSEEVLRALMQLFAIIANQDGGSGSMQELYVKRFLKSQISDDRIPEFLEYFRSFIKEQSGEEEGTRRTSMKDSVRTLAICKKINKTLNQKQKVVVLARLEEFVQQEAGVSASRNELLTTAADVFNVGKDDFQAIRNLFAPDAAQHSGDVLLVADETAPGFGGRFYDVHGFPGSCVFLYLRDAGLLLLVYRGTAEVSLNGLPVNPGQVYVFSPGSALRHNRGTVFYSEIINRFLNETFARNVHFTAAINAHRHPGGKMALHRITLNEKSGTLTGIMGASGSGKTTLLNVLSGMDPVTDGRISINGNVLGSRQVVNSGMIGYIPQDDLLMEELTVFQNLFLSARLCFRTISDEELTEKVNQLLQSLGLYEVREIKVGHPLNKKISGGQRKRLNIALELIREPELLFVDEPTSGLSSKDSENVMDLLKELSQKGKLIFVVIHQPSSDVYKLFDKIFLLDAGGYPVYSGDPVEALLYFKKATNQINSHIAECHACGSVNPEQLFNLIEAKEIDEYGNYTAKRKLTPEGWNQLYRETLAAEPAEQPAHEALRKADKPTRFKQWLIFLRRDWLSKISNRQYMFINLLEVPFLALLLAMLIRFVNRSSSQTAYSYYYNDNLPAFFFMAIVVALLVGLTVSAEEIYKDQKILRREKFLRLSRLSYLCSKVLLLFGLSLIQSVLLAIIGSLVLEIPGSMLPLTAVLFSVFCSANLIGLVLSSSFNSPVTIYIIIPLIIIPQMLFGGAMFRYGRLNEWLGGGENRVPPVAQVMVARWAYEGIAVQQYTSSEWEKPLFVAAKLESKFSYKVSYLIPKLEELQDKIDKETAPPAQLALFERIISHTLRSEYAEVAREFPPLTAGKTDSLEVLKEFYGNRYNFFVNKKESIIQQLRKSGKEKEMCTNRNLEELLTNSTEKNKIVLDTAALQFVQLIDPVYKEPQHKAGLGLNAHFYAPAKYLFGVRMNTLLYNLLMIWLLNVVTFLVLYFDWLRKLFHWFGNIKPRKAV